MTAQIIRFDIFDTRTGNLIKSVATRNSANRVSDNRDNKFGACITRVVAVWSDK